MSETTTTPARAKDAGQRLPLSIDFHLQGDATVAHYGGSVLNKSRGATIAELLRSVGQSLDPKVAYELVFPPEQAAALLSGAMEMLASSPVLRDALSKKIVAHVSNRQIQAPAGLSIGALPILLALKSIEERLARQDTATSENLLV